MSKERDAEEAAAIAAMDPFRGWRRHKLPPVSWRKLDRDPALEPNSLIDEINFEGSDGGPLPEATRGPRHDS